MNRLLKGLVLFLVALSLVFSFCACKQEGESPAPPVTPASVEKVTLNKKTLDMTSGESLQLTATVLPEGVSQEVTWSINKDGKSYASVSSDGKVKVSNTGNDNASAIITATSVADPTKKASCKITIHVAPPSKFDLSSVGMVTAGPGENASTSMVISWHSPTQGSSLEYTDANGDAFTNTKANADCNEALSTAKWADTATHYRCKVTLEGLTPNATYKYRINDGSDNYSDEATFRTAGTDTTFQFMWLSDLHTGKYGDNYIATVGKLIDFANEKEGVDVDFCLFTGDMVNKGQIYKHWNNWSESKLMNDMTYAFVCGNHDYYPYGTKDRTTNEYFKDFAAYPANNTAGGKSVLDSNYWFIWNRVLFVCIDNFTSEGSETKKLPGANPEDQRAWFKAVLDSIPTSDYDYLVYAQHLPFFTDDDESCDYGFYEDWYEIFDQYKVDFALSSDEHAYFRTKPLLNDVATELEDGKVKTGTVYVVSDETEGSSISKLSNKASATAKYAAFNAGGGVAGAYFTVTSSEMTLHVIGQGGTEYDSVTVLKKDR